MKITKFVHACLLVEMPNPVNRTALFDPGTMSEGALDVEALEYLDDIIITHKHEDHFSLPLIKQLVGKFPDVRLTAPPEVADILRAEGMAAKSQPVEGVVLFDSPHAEIRPFFDDEPPQQIGVHYLDLLTDPGDSHDFVETMSILALPVQAPWGSTNHAVELALRLKPKHVLPVHDWHWSEDARKQQYNKLKKRFAEADITFHKLETGKAIVIDTPV